MSYTRNFPSQEESDRYFEQIKKDREEYYRRSGIDPATVEIPSPPPRSELTDEFLRSLQQMGVEDCLKIFAIVKDRVREIVEKRMVEAQGNIARESIHVDFCREVLESAFNGTNCKPLAFPHR